MDFPQGETLIPDSPPRNFIIHDFHVQQILFSIQKTWNFLNISYALHNTINKYLDFLVSHFEYVKKHLEQELWNEIKKSPNFWKI